jgi:hypothetical protein
MTYFPKSQIKTNLYSTGEYIYLSNGEPYIGAYYKISTGKTYIGATPSFPNSPEIVISPNKVLIDGIIENIDPIGPPPLKSILITNISPYSQITPPTPFLRSLPQPYQTLPTPQNYEDKIFSRYFAKKTNELKYKEISKQTYTLLKNKDTSIAWDLYEPVKLEWEIRGDKSIIFRNNKTTITKIEQNKKWYGFSNYLKEDYTKYWKP